MPPRWGPAPPSHPSGAGAAANAGSQSRALEIRRRPLAIFSPLSTKVNLPFAAEGQRGGRRRRNPRSRWAETRGDGGVRPHQFAWLLLDRSSL